MAKTFEKEAIVEFDIKMLGVVEDRCPTNTVHQLHFEF